MMLIQHSVNSDWLFNSQSRVLQADWFILGINEKATLSINMTYLHVKSYHETKHHGTYIATRSTKTVTTLIRKMKF